MSKLTDKIPMAMQWGLYGSGVFSAVSQLAFYFLTDMPRQELMLRDWRSLTMLGMGAIIQVLRQKSEGE